MVRVGKQKIKTFRIAMYIYMILCKQQYQLLIIECLLYARYCIKYFMYLILFYSSCKLLSYYHK